MLLQFGGNGDGLPGEQRRNPFGGPGALARVIDARQRLQGDGSARVIGQRAAEIVPVAAHGERRRADRSAEVKGEDLGARIAPELQGHQRQQHALAGASRSDDQGVAHVADMETEAEWRGPFRPREEQRGRLEMLIPFRPGPHGRERHHVSEVERRDWWLADIGVDVSGE